MKIVFVHGRSQQKKDEAALRKAWLDAAIKGVADAGLAAVSALADNSIAFRYYGDLLFKLVEDAGRAQFQTLVERGADASAPSSEEQDFTQEIVFEVAAANGVYQDAIAAEVGGPVDRGIQNWKAVLAALRLLDRIPHVGQELMELLTRDVWYYLTKKGLRQQIDAVVDAAIPTDERCIVVAHSLGTIVAYNVLMNRQRRDNVNAFITIGSPLGIGAILKRLPSDTPPRTAPAGVLTWLNARDARDTVALYEIPTDKYRGAPEVVNYSAARNDSDNRHGIVEYLDDPTIATAIRDAILLATPT